MNGEQMAPGTALADRPSWVPATLLVLTGAALCASLASSAPGSVGAATLASPVVALGIFDTLWLLVLARPGGGLAADRLVLVLLGAVFHVTLAASAGAGVEHHGAFGLILGGYAALGALSRSESGRLRAGLLAGACFAVPLVGYACIEFAGVDAWGLLHAAPTTAPAWLAGRAATASATDGLPGLALAVVLVAIELLVGWRSHRERARASADAIAVATPVERPYPGVPRR